MKFIGLDLLKILVIINSFCIFAAQSQFEYRIGVNL